MFDERQSRILAALETVRAPAQPGEYDLHALVSAALLRAGIDAVHEYRLAPRCRIDFLCGTIGIEVKKGRPDRRALLAQLSRYLGHDALTGIIVVTQRAVALPPHIAGKCVHLVSLNRLWGVALP
jgi:hypothetical protein